MLKKIITVAVGAIAIAVPAGIAAAAPEIAVSPTSVDAAGEQAVEVTLSGFTAEAAVFVLPCAYPAGGDVAAFDNTTCDQTQLSPVVIDADGGGSVTATYDVPAEGLAVYVTDADVAETGVALITVGADTGTDAPVDDTAAAGDGTPAPTAVNTGDPISGSSNTALLGLAFGMLVLAGGALTLRHVKR